jgi:hypothetical protein
VALVFQKGEIVIAGGPCLKLANEIATVLCAIDADGQDLRVFFANDILQLAELLRAIGSPVTAVEDQHDGFFAAVVGQRNIFPVLTLQSEIRRRLADFDPLEIGSGEIGSVFWTELRESRFGREEKRD